MRRREDHREAAGRLRGLRALGLRARRVVGHAIAALAIAAAARAGSTGEALPVLRARLAPAIDGVGDAVWGDVPATFFGQDAYNLTVRALHDDRTLYLLIQDLTDLDEQCEDRFSVFFEDEGGGPSRLWNDLFDAGSCLGLANQGEGRIDVSCGGDGHIFRQRLSDGSTCGGFAQASGVVARIRKDFPEPELSGVTAELAIPLDEPTALRAAAGDEFGIFLEVEDADVPGLRHFWPEEQVGSEPEWYANAKLATLGCNAPRAEDFDPGFGADWETLVAPYRAWSRTPACGSANQTGGAGEAACFVLTSAEAETAHLATARVSLVGVTAAELRFRANFQQAGSSGFVVAGSGDDFASISFLAIWTTDHGAPGGPGEEVVVPVPPALLDQSDVSFRFVFTAPASNGSSFAQIDDVRLTCGPLLFTDGFETGLTTHWSSTAPYP